MNNQLQRDNESAGSRRLSMVVALTILGLLMTLFHVMGI